MRSWLFFAGALALAACDDGNGAGGTDTEDASSSTAAPSSSGGPTSTTDAMTSTSTSTGTPTTAGVSTGDTTGDGDESTDGGSEEGSTGTGGGEDGVPVVVAVGATHARYVSLDEGLTWCQTGRTDDPEGQEFDTPFLLRNVSYGDGVFIAGSWRAIFVSENGLEWEDITGDENPAFGQWTAQIQHGNGWWVATGGYGTAMRSQDLETWEVTSEGLPGTEASRSLAFGNGMFVTGRDNVGWWQSADGAQWTQLDAGADSRVVFDGADFVPHPGYDEGPGGVRLRGAWPDGIERAVGEGAWEQVGTAADGVTRFAFGNASQASLDGAVVDAALADCLGR